MGCTDCEKYYFGKDIRLMTQLAAPVVGTALLLTADTSTPGHKADMEDYWRALKIIEESAIPKVVVIKTIGSRKEHECVLGDGMAKTLKASGSAGLITDGGIRDIRQIDRAGYPVFAAGATTNRGA